MGLWHWWEMFRLLSPVTSDLYASQLLHWARLGNRNVNKQSSSPEIPAPLSQICKIFVGCFKQPNTGLQSVVTDLRRFNKCIKAFLFFFPIISHNYLFPVCLVSFKSFFLEWCFHFLDENAVETEPAPLEYISNPELCILRKRYKETKEISEAVR